MQDPHHGKKPGMHAICIPSPSFLDFHFVAVFYVLVGAKKSVCELLNVVTVTLFFFGAFLISTGTFAAARQAC